MGNARVQDLRPKLAVFVETMRADPNRPVILSEGDSWFSYPINRNLMDHIEMMREFATLRLEHNGDEVLDILKPSGEQFRKLDKYLKKYPFDVLLFSGGGNDIVDENLPAFLNRKTPGMTWRDCINEAALTARFNEIVSAYVRLLELRDAVRRDCLVVTHCYDYPVPNGIKARVAFGLASRGPWIKPHLVKLGIDPIVDGVPIMRFFMDQFYDRLQAIATSPSSKFHVVDSRRTLIPNEPIHWSDEMHPSGTGFELLAQRWRVKLAKLFPAWGL